MSPSGGPERALCSGLKPSALSCPQRGRPPQPTHPTHGNLYRKPLGPRSCFVPTVGFLGVTQDRRAKSGSGDRFLRTRLRRALRTAGGCVLPQWWPPGVATGTQASVDHGLCRTRSPTPAFVNRRGVRTLAGGTSAPRRCQHWGRFSWARGVAGIGGATGLSLSLSRSWRSPHCLHVL